MKFIKDNFPVICLSILGCGFFGLIIVATIEDNNRDSLIKIDKKEQSKFMVDNKCIISIFDETLLRKGCVDINNEIHWRE